MAQKVSVQLLCDMHDSGDVEGTETVSFSLDGQPYEIDLCDKHAADMRKKLDPFTGQARRANVRSITSGKSGKYRKPAASDGEAAKVRAWARENGLEVPERGRMPGEVTAKYAAAHSG